MGRLGFLSSVEKTKMAQIIQGIERNTINYEPRTLLGINSNIPLFIDSPFALNDFTLHKRDTSSMVTIHAAIDGKYLNTYWADGLIVSTPTGSTGYSLACGGPIVFPESSNFVITPIAPHNLNVRPLVISDSAEITLQIEGRSENFLCTLDNRYETVTHEHMVKIKKNDFTITLGTLENTEFMNTIRQKLMWGLDKRN
jgi:NAD+ kinase